MSIFYAASPQVQRVQKVQKVRGFRGWWERFLRLTGLSAGGFLSLTALRDEGCGIALRAMSFIILLCRMENQTTGLRPMEMHPFCLRHLSTGKHVTGFSGRFTPLQHGYHRLTEFSGRYSSPTNPVRWCNSSSFATLCRGQNKPLYASPQRHVAQCLASIVPLCTSCIGCASRAK